MPELTATPGQTIGPFFGYALPYPGDQELVPRGSAGSVRLHGHVYVAVPAAPGSRHRDAFTGWGRAATDAAGHYWFSTVEPGPGRPGGAPFFAVAVFARGLLSRLFTRIYLPAGPDILQADPLLATLGDGERRALVAAREGDGSLRFDVHLKGPLETPFLTFPRHAR